MKCLLDQYDRLPRTIPDEQLSALQQGKEVSHNAHVSFVILAHIHSLSLFQLLSYMLDRNAALLPAYIAHDEVCHVSCTR